MSWPPALDSSLVERTKAWKEELGRRRKVWADAQYSGPAPVLPRPEKTWPATDYSDDWINKRVRVKRGFKGHPTIKKGALGLVVDWDDGWPVIWFGKGDGSKDNPKDDWESVPLDRLEEVFLFKQHRPSCVEGVQPPPEFFFATTKELLALDIVQHYRRPGFSHFVKSEELLMAIFDDGYCWWVVGSVSNSAVLDLPLWDGGKYRAKLPDGTTIELTGDMVVSSCGGTLTLRDGTKVEKLRQGKMNG